ncbi:MAG: LemA family protein [Acidobacteriota bacterium]
MSKAVLAVVGVAVAVVAVVGLMAVGQYNGLVREAQAVDQQWSQVENVYQRRADLVPNLVTVVQGSASFEKSTLVQVTEARSRVGQVSSAGAANDPQALERFAQAQAQLGAALSRLMVVVENYPELKSTESFLTLQTQLAGAENRIAVERKRYNEAAQGYNTRLQRVPAAWFVAALGWNFKPKAYFQAETGAEQAPAVKM